MYIITIWKKRGHKFEGELRGYLGGVSGRKDKGQMLQYYYKLNFLIFKKSNLFFKELNDSCEIVLAFYHYNEIPDTMYLSSKKRFM